MRSQKSHNENIVEFLLSDFNDTSEHLRVTGRKIEFTFQLYAGFLSLLITLIVSLLTLTPDTFVRIFSELGLQILYGVASGVLVLIAAITWWVFEFSLRGSMMNKLYINRMNFLRHEIYKALGKNTNKLDGFAYAARLLPKTKSAKVGMTELFPLALQSIFSFFTFPALCICIFLTLDPLNDWAQTHLLLVLTLILLIIIFGGVFYALFERRWKSVINDTQRMIQANWSVGGEAK